MRFKFPLILYGVLFLSCFFVFQANATAQLTAADCQKSIPSAVTKEELAKFDWSHLWRYCMDDVRLGLPAPGENRVVFFGDSITEAWNLSKFFPGKPYINRGASGETSSQMLLRFRQDVIHLEPKVVLILAGTNDIAGNTGPITVKAIEDNFASMAEVARANGVRVVLASVLPTVDYPWRHGQEPVEKIIALNSWLKAYASAHGLVYVDYYTAMQDGRHGLPPNLSGDGVHPNDAGYAIMQPLTEQAIAQALR